MSLLCGQPHKFCKLLHFLDCFDSARLSQNVHFNTRRNSCLDLLFTNRPSFLLNCTPVPGFGDHDTAALADIICHPQKIKPVQRKIHCWKRADIESLHKDMKTEMKNLVNKESVDTEIDQLWNKFKEITLRLQDKYVPTRITSKRYSQPWFNRDCKRIIRKKIRRYRVFKRTKLDKDWIRYK